MKQKWFFPLCTVLLAAFIAFISGAPSFKTALHTHGVLHPWFHLLAFAAVSLTAMLCSGRTSVRTAMLCGLLLLAWGTEYREHLADGMPVEQADVVDDVIGIAAGAALGWALSRRAQEIPT